MDKPTAMSMEEWQKFLKWNLAMDNKLKQHVKNAEAGLAKAKQDLKL